MDQKHPSNSSQDNATQATEGQSTTRHQSLRDSRCANSPATTTDSEDIHGSGLTTLAHTIRQQTSEWTAQLNAAQENLDAERMATEQLRRLLAPTVTPRLLMAIDHFRRTFPTILNPSRLITPLHRQDSLCDEQMWSSLDLETNDEQRAQVLEWIRGQDDGWWDRNFTSCAVCQLPRHKGTEYMPQRLISPCCQKSVCKDCLKTSVCKELSTGWWHELDSSGAWFHCPAPGCGGSLGLQQEEAVRATFIALEVSDLDGHMEFFRKGTQLRDALKAIRPRPSPDALAMAASVHECFIVHGMIFDFFDTSFGRNCPSTSSQIQIFRPGPIAMCKARSEDHVFPIFTQFIRRKPEARTCSVCADVLYEFDIEDYEFDIEDHEEWQQATLCSDSSWIQDILLFPTNDEIQCTHEIDFCKSCLKEHIELQLSTGGRDICNRLTCPGQRCERALSRDEIKPFVSEEALEKYDRLTLLNYVSSEANFRWCLGESCDNGFFCDPDDPDFDPHIYCGECQFQMCFTHQVPWHMGLSCDQYDSQRAHGDPENEETEAYLATKTKRCPNDDCGARIQKDGGCFHMTCESCHHDFCWECLASWAEIKPTVDEYNREAHKEGCWFRNGDLEATDIGGDDLDAALEFWRRG